MIAEVYVVRKPGDGGPASPCGRKCRHGMCSRLRKIADLLCTTCEKPAGYDRPMITRKVNEDGSIAAIVHLSCAIRNITGSTAPTCNTCGRPF